MLGVGVVVVVSHHMRIKLITAPFMQSLVTWASATPKS